LILGCTHYPMLKAAIARQMGEGVTLVDSAEACSRSLEEMLSRTGLSADPASVSQCHLYVTDLPARFEGIAHRFLDGETPSVTRVDL